MKPEPVMSNVLFVQSDPEYPLTISNCMVDLGLDVDECAIIYLMGHH